MNVVFQIVQQVIDNDRQLLLNMDSSGQQQSKQSSAGVRAELLHDEVPLALLLFSMQQEMLWEMYESIVSLGGRHGIKKHHRKEASWCFGKCSAAQIRILPFMWMLL